jgi:hypothetical protein
MSEIFNRRDRFNCVCKITPAWAKQILETRNNHNREKKPQAIREYAADMKAGRFPRTYEGIAFDSNGVLMDGQNRLHAIVEVGKENPDFSIEMLVFLNEPPENAEFINKGRRRSLADSMNLGKRINDVKNGETAVCRCMIDGLSSGYSLSDQTLIDLFCVHRDAISFAKSVLPSSVFKKAASGPVRAVLPVRGIREIGSD